MKRFRLGLGGKYLLFVVGLVLIVVSVSFTKLFEIEKNFILTQLEGQARFLCRQILLTRSWVADQGGVYVEARPGRKANPYLACGVVEATDGRRFLLRNPAMVTRELSEYAAKRSLYRFRLTSTHLINRDNAPDGVERRALEIFRQGKQDEYSLMQTLDGEPVFRYIKALFIEPSCLQCHCYQGYEKGQLRGCLSVIIPSAAAQARIAGLHRSLLCDGGLIILLILLVLVLLNHFLTVRPLKRLNRQVRDFERDVNAVVRPLSRSDEIGTLSSSLAQMSLTIREQHQSMEKRVVRATENLRRVNRELVEANRSLKQQDALKTDFLATVSHELRTPLTTIRGGVDYLLQTISDPDQQGYLRLLERNIENLVEMVNNLIDLARIDLRRIELEWDEVDLAVLLEDLIVLFAASAEEKGVAVVVRGELPRVTISGDCHRLNQIFMNLLHNAVKFSPHGSVVEVELAECREKIEVRVIDHGVGITEEELGELFTRYRFRCKCGARSGSGLGLAITRGLVEAHGGVLKAASRPGVETVFTVILPRDQKKKGDKNGT